MNPNNNFPDQQWQDVFTHQNELLSRLRDMMGDTQSEIDAEPNDLQLGNQENFLLAPQDDRMANSSPNWLGGGIVTEALQRLTPIAVGDDHYPNQEIIQIDPFGPLLQPPPRAPMFNMDNRQRLEYDEVESQSVEVILPGLIFGDMNNQVRPATRPTEDEDVVYLGQRIANQERAAFNRSRPRSNNGLVADPFLANIRHTEHEERENRIRQGIEASAMANTGNPFARLLTPSPPTSHDNSRRPFGSEQMGPSTFSRLERNAFVEDPHLANNVNSGFDYRGILDPETQRDYFPDSAFNNAANQFVYLSPPPAQATNEEDNILFSRYCRSYQGASGTERSPRSNSDFEGRNTSNNRQSQLGGNLNQDNPTFDMPSRDNPFANVPPPPIPPLNFAFPVGTLSYTVPIISLDQVRERLRQRNEAIAGRGPPPPPLVPDGEAELCYLGSPSFAGLNVGGSNGRGDNGGRHNGRGDNGDRHNGRGDNGGRHNGRGDNGGRHNGRGDNDGGHNGRWVNDGGNSGRRDNTRRHNDRRDNGGGFNGSRDNGGGHGRRDNDGGHNGRQDNGGGHNGRHDNGNGHNGRQDNGNGHNGRQDNGNGHNGRQDNGGGNHGVYSEGIQNNWEHFPQTTAGDFNHSQVRFMPHGSNNGRLFERRGFYGEGPRTFF